MDSHKKSFLIYSIIIPIVIAVFVTASFFLIICNVSDSIIFKEREFAFSDYTSGELKNMQEVEVKNNTVSKKDMHLSDNTIIGKVDIDGQVMDIVYNASELNTAGRLNISGNIIVGESGACYLFCNKKDNMGIRMMDKKDKLEVNTFYGDFSYEVVKITTCDNEAQLKSVADKYSHSIVFYTDSNDGVGINNDYFVVVCAMRDGTRVMQ